MNHIIAEPHAVAGLAAKLPAMFLRDEKTAERFFGFFTANIRNRNTRRAYYKAACRFSDWCEGRGLLDLAHVKPAHVAAYIEWLGKAEPEGQGLSKPTLKQHLAALRMLFDWLVVGHILDTNPAHAVRGPKYSQRKGKTPVLDRGEARALLAVIDTGSFTGLRDRALIGVMIYTFARVGAALQMNVGDYFSQGRRGWVRLHEKGGKEHEAPRVPKLEMYLDEYIAAAGIAGDIDAPLFRTTGRSTGTPHDATGRLPDDRPLCKAIGHQNENRQSHTPRNGHHGLPDKRGFVSGESARDGKSRRHTHDPALRPARGCGLTR
jgi:integrase/recombinase XerD